MSKFEIGDRVVKIDVDRVAVVQDVLTSKVRCGSMYLICFEDDGKYYSVPVPEDKLMAYEEPNKDYTITIHMEGNRMVACMSRINEDGSIEEICSSHGTIALPGEAGIAQAAGHAVKMIYFRLKKENPDLDYTYHGEEERGEY